MDEITSVPVAVVPHAVVLPTQTMQACKRRSRLGRLLRCGLALLTLLALLFGTSLVLRSEWFLRRRIDPRLAELGQKLHGDFHYDAVRPAGLTGVAVDGLTFVPWPSATGSDDDAPLAVPLTIDRLVVYPDVGAMFLGDLQPRSLEVHGLRAEFWLDGGPSGRGHWPWLEQVVETWTRDLPEASSGSGGGRSASLPRIHIFDSRVDIVSPGGTMPHIGASVADLTLHSVDGQLRLDGAIKVDGLGYALLSGDADSRSRSAGVVVELVDTPDLLAIAPEHEGLRSVVGPDSRLQIEGISVRWPPALTVHGPRITHTHIGVPGQDQAYIEEVGAGSLTVRFADERAEIEVHDLDARMRVTWFGGLTTSLPLRLPRFDALVDFEARRIGAGFELAAERSGSLALTAALDLRALDLAVQLEASAFDAGRMLSFIPYTGPLTVTRGIVDGHVRVRYPLLEQLVEVDAEIDLSELDADIPWLAQGTLESARFGVDVHSVVDLRERRLRIDHGRLRVGELELAMAAEVEQVDSGRDVRVEARLAAERLRGEEVLSSLPRGFAPALEGYELSGEFGLALDLALDTREIDAMVLDYDLTLDTLKVVRHGPRADIPVLASNDFAIRVRTATDGTVLSPAAGDEWTPLFRLPRHVVAALVASEDARFYSHQGFDSKAIHNSVVANLNAGRVVRGGSTISQQVVKNLFLDQSKTVSRKLQEAFLTWQLELHVPKQRILELYVNLAHWGPDIYGLREAARFYFNKRPSQLTVRESLFLAAILPNPIRFGRQYQEGVIQADRLTKMRNGLLALHRRGLVDKSAYEAHLDKLGRAIISSQPPPPLTATTTTQPEPSEPEVGEGG